MSAWAAAWALLPIISPRCRSVRRDPGSQNLGPFFQTLAQRDCKALGEAHIQTPPKRGGAMGVEWAEREEGLDASQGFFRSKASWQSV